MLGFVDDHDNWLERLLGQGLQCFGKRFTLPDADPIKIQFQSTQRNRLQPTLLRQLRDDALVGFEVITDGMGDEYTWIL